MGRSLLIQLITWSLVDFLLDILFFTRKLLENVNISEETC